MPATSRLSVLLAVSVAVSTAALPALAAKPVKAEQSSLSSVMAGEFALQAGRMPEAVDWYLRAAKQEAGDAGLAERATLIALQGNDNDKAAEALKLWQQRGKRTLSLRGAEATLALRQGELEQAQTDLASMMREPGEEGWGRALLALGRGSREPAVAERVMTHLLEEAVLPNVLGAWVAFGGLAQRQGLNELVQRTVGEAAKRFPDEPRIVLLHASQLRQSGKPDEARVMLDGLANDPKLAAELRNSVALEYAALGDSERAAAVIAQGPQTNQSYAMRASLLARVKDKRSLTALYDEVRAKVGSDDPQRLLLLGEIAQFLERPQDALAWYERVPRGPHRIEARLRSANALYELGRKAEAFDQARQMQADASLDDLARQAAYLLEAELKQKDKDDAGELDVLARGLAAWPDDGGILYARALAWERRDDIVRAEADFRRILATDPENTAALNALGYTLADRTDRFQEALELIERARAAAPDDAAIVDSYGWVLYRLGRNEEALIELRRAYSLGKDAEIAAHVGEVLWVMGRKDEARKYFDESRNIDPENRSLLRALEKAGL